MKNKIDGFEMNYDEELARILASLGVIVSFDSAAVKDGRRHPDHGIRIVYQGDDKDIYDALVGTDFGEGREAPSSPIYTWERSANVSWCDCYDVVTGVGRALTPLSPELSAYFI